MGLCLMFSLFALMKRLKVDTRVNFLLTTLFMVSPAVILYENWLLYEYPIATALCMAALCLHRYAQSGSRKDGIMFFVLLMILVLLRAIFHWGWFVLCAAALMALQKGKR